MEIAPEIFLPGTEAAGMSLSAAQPLLGPSPGAAGLGGAVPALDVPWASPAVLGHPGLSPEPRWALQRLGSWHHHSNIPQPWGEQHRAMAVSSFCVIFLCFTFLLWPTSPGSSGPREASGTQGSSSMDTGGVSCGVMERHKQSSGGLGQ